MIPTPRASAVTTAPPMSACA